MTTHLELCSCSAEVYSPAYINGLERDTFNSKTSHETVTDSQKLQKENENVFCPLKSLTALPYVRQLIAVLSNAEAKANLRPTHGESVINNVVLGQVFTWILLFFVLIIIRTVSHNLAFRSSTVDAT